MQHVNGFELQIAGLVLAICSSLVIITLIYILPIFCNKRAAWFVRANVLGLIFGVFFFVGGLHMIRLGL